MTALSYNPLPRWWPRLALTGALLLAPLAATCAPLLSVSLSSAAVTMGDSFTATVHVDQMVDLYGYQFDLRFDPLLLSASSMLERTFLSNVGPALFVPGHIDNGLGLVSFVAGTLSGAIAGADGSGDLVEFTFSALSVGLAGLSIDNLLLFDSLGAAIGGATLQGASVQINAGGPVGLPEPGTLLLVLPLALGLLWGRHRGGDAAPR